MNPSLAHFTALATVAGMARGLLNDEQIACMCMPAFLGFDGDEYLHDVGKGHSEYRGVPGAMLDPFVPHAVRQVGDRGVISFGLSSFGYDIRAGQAWQVYSMGEAGVVDPKSTDSCTYSMQPSKNPVWGEFVVIPAGGYARCASLERFSMPKDVAGVVFGKSTYARAGLIMNVTPLEPGWRGYLTMAMFNATPRPLRVYVGEGIAQVMFFRGSKPEVNYASKGGKYQDQPAEPVGSRL